MSSDPAALWVDRVWGNREGFACLGVGFGGHFKGESYTFKSFAEDFFPWPAERERLLAKATEYASKGDVYVCPLLRRERSRKQGTALPGNMPWADLDELGGEIRGFERALIGPNGLLVDSGNGLHPYLWLPEELEPAELERLNRHLAHALGADAGWSETKYLRLPGTWNHKGRAREEESSPVTLRDFTPAEQDWPLGELMQLLGPAPLDVGGDGIAMFEPAMPASAPAHLLARLSEASSDRSTQSFNFVRDCIGSGLSDAETLALTLEHGPTKEKYGDRAASEIRRVIQKLRAAGIAVEPQPEPIIVERSRHVDGATFIFSVPETVPSLWGHAQNVLWAQGEGLMLVGPDGVGKTTLGQQLVLARLGLRAELLGLPVTVATGRVLYIAADRPRQAASSLRRMVDTEHVDVLRERLEVWKGPLPVDVVEKPRALLEWIRKEFGDISDVYVDSLKDIALDLVKDETGSRVNNAFQELVADSIELAVNHHQRKEMQGGGKPRRLADVYGSRWLTAGMGSVVLLWGEPGDLIVDLAHLKQPVETYGPHQVIHDHERGASTLHHQADLLTSLRDASDGLTVADAARLMFGEEKPDRNQIERGRRRLNGYVETGHAERHDDPDGLARYFYSERPA